MLNFGNGFFYRKITKIIKNGSVSWKKEDASQNARGKEILKNKSKSQGLGPNSYNTPYKGGGCSS
jgi:hypothetical protein